jgi:RepB DNA-primase from phage plasmid
LTGLFKGRLRGKHTGECVYFSSAVRKSKCKSFLVANMSFEKHNRWRRIIPAGWTTTKLKNKLAKTTLNSRDRGILRLVLDCAPPPPSHEYDIQDAIAWKEAINSGLKPPAPQHRPIFESIDNKKYFMLSVKFICAALNFDAEKTWPRARKRLEKCTSKYGKKLLQIGFKQLFEGDCQWFLAFDFTCLTDGSLDALPLANKKKKQTMKNDKLNKKWGGHATQTNCGGHDPVILAGSEPVIGEEVAVEQNPNSTGTPPHAGGQQTQPSLPLPLPLPLPTSAAILSYPPPGGGVLEGSTKVKLLEDSVFFDLKIFYDFAIKNEAVGINVHHQRRNKVDKNGKVGRGGTFNPYLKNNYNQLCWLVRRAASRQWEIGCGGGQFILVDDLDINSVKELMAEKLSVCILETSLGNFQAILPKIGIWSDAQTKETQEALCGQFGGDANAVSSRQPHRLPGSLNQKNNDCFVTKLSLIQDGKILSPLDFSSTQIIEKPKAAIKKQGHRNDSGKDETASGQDFGMVCKMLKTGKCDQEILSKLLASCEARCKKGSHQKYANLTLKNARTILKI